MATKTSTALKNELANAMEYNGGLKNIGAAQKALLLNPSHEDIAGNMAVSCSLEWSLNPDAANSNVALQEFQIDFDVENWALGTLFYADIDPGAQDDILTNTHAPSSDVTPVVYTTGGTSSLNVTVSGRAGHAKIHLAYVEGTGGSKITAYNQFWPVVLTLT